MTLETTMPTRAEYREATERAHDALHDWERMAGPGHPLHGPITRAHDALHEVGAGVEQVVCGNADPEVAAAVTELVASLQNPLGCGHKVADLISAPGTVTRCGHCILEKRAVLSRVRAERVDGSGPLLEMLPLHTGRRYLLVQTLQPHPSPEEIETAREQLVHVVARLEEQGVGATPITHDGSQSFDAYSFASASRPYVPQSDVERNDGTLAACARLSMQESDVIAHLAAENRRLRAALLDAGEMSPRKLVFTIGPVPSTEPQEEKPR